MECGIATEDEGQRQQKEKERLKAAKMCILPEGFPLEVNDR